MVIVAVAVTVASGGAGGAIGGFWSGVFGTSATGAVAATVATAATAAALGSVASQVVGIAIGAQDRFSWKGVALAAIGRGASEGLLGWSPVPGTSSGVALANTVVRSAVGNALTQGIAVATGLQDKFSWRAVASSAVGAGVGAAVSGDMGNPTSFAPGQRAALPQEQQRRSRAVGV
jgi:hypothetical protein